MGSFGFSYMGLIFLLLLFVPNLIWIKHQPTNYSSKNENKLLLGFERVGEILVSTIVLIFSDFNFHGWNLWSIWLLFALFTMLLYELWWLRYFRSQQRLEDLYSSFGFVPVAGASLPIIAFLFLSIYGKVIWLGVAVIILGIGHIGLHLQHRQEIK